MGSGSLRRRSGAARAVGGALAASLLLTACWFGGDDETLEPPPLTTAPPSLPVDDGPTVNVEGADEPATNPLGVELSNGDTSEPEATAV